MGNQLTAFDHAVNHPKPHLPSHAHAYSSQFPCSMVVSPPRDVAVARFARGCLLVRLDVDPLRACCRLSPRGALEKSALPPPPPPFSLDPLHQPEPSNPPMFLSFTRCGCVAISPTQGAGTERAVGVAQRLSGFQGAITAYTASLLYPSPNLPRRLTYSRLRFGSRGCALASSRVT